jgi:hypothetical protein
MSRMLSRGTERVRNASGTMPKTKTKTKYLRLTFSGWLALKESGETSKQSFRTLRVRGRTVAC